MSDLSPFRWDSYIPHAAWMPAEGEPTAREGQSCVVLVLMSESKQSLQRKTIPITLGLNTVPCSLLSSTGTASSCTGAVKISSISCEGSLGNSAAKIKAAYRRYAQTAIIQRLLAWLYLD